MNRAVNRLLQTVFATHPILRVCWSPEYAFVEHILLTPFQPSVAFHIETSCLICSTNQITGSYMKCNSGDCNRLTSLILIYSFFMYNFEQVSACRDCQEGNYPYWQFQENKSFSRKLFKPLLRSH